MCNSISYLQITLMHPSESSVMYWHFPHWRHIFWFAKSLNILSFSVGVGCNLLYSLHDKLLYHGTLQLMHKGSPHSIQQHLLTSASLFHLESSVFDIFFFWKNVKLYSTKKTIVYNKCNMNLERANRIWEMIMCPNFEFETNTATHLEVFCSPSSEVCWIYSECFCQWA